MHKRSLQRLAAGTTLVVLAGMIFAQATKPATRPTKTVTPSGLTIIEQEPAGASVAEAGDSVWVHYVGKLTDGTEFDASAKHSRDGFNFMLGMGAVIRGWDEGIAGMKIGERRQLIIPPDLGYGAAGAPPRIPANATLVFDVQLLGLKKTPK